VEQITTSAVSGVAVPVLPFLVLKAPRAGAILLAPLRGIKAISAVLVSHWQKCLDSAKRPGVLLNVFSLTRVINQIFRVAGTRWRSDCAGPALKTHTQAGPDSAAGVATRGAAGRLIADDRQALLERIDLLERKLADASISIPHETDWVPLVKTPVASGARLGTTSKTAGRASMTALEHYACDRKKAVMKGNFDLEARKVLCVGGKAALYPEYRRLVEASGATLFFYRSDPRPARGQRLSKLLAQADMVVCPVDCINHEAYFTAKRYCKYSGTPYVVLDRSDISTFRKGVATLTELAAVRVGDRKRVESTEPPSLA
jgi:hypothetical protein